jgi:hypothetical protein
LRIPGRFEDSLRGVSCRKNGIAPGGSILGPEDGRLKTPQAASALSTVEDNNMFVSITSLSLASAKTSVAAEAINPGPTPGRNTVLEYFLAARIWTDFFPYFT